MDDSTRSLLRRARQGDAEAVAMLLMKDETRLRRIVEARGGRLLEQVRASDILQSTFLDVIRGEFRGESEDDFRVWVTAILENNMRDVGRRLGAKKRGRDQVAPASREPELPAGTGTPSAVASSVEEVELARSAMEHLAEDYQTVLRLCLLEGRPHREVAETMGRSEVATRLLLLRARAALLAEVARRQGGLERM